MTEHIVVVGMGQLGAVFAEGFLRTGHTVTPVLRGDDVTSVCEKTRPNAVLVATGEDDLMQVLRRLPSFAQDRVILIQNELRPDQWQAHQLEPTVGIVWFEKRKGKQPHVVLPSVLYGRHAALLSDALSRVELAHRTISSQEDLAHELVLKNLYILGINLTGLRVGGVAKELLTTHRTLFRSVVGEILPIEAALLDAAPPFTGALLDEARLWKDLEGALLADPDHSCAGRSAPRRLERTLAHAARLGVKTPILTQLAQEKK